MREKKICPRCRKVTAEEFCPSCGENLTQVRSSFAEIDEQERQQEAERRGGLLRFIGIGVILIVVIGLSIGYLFYYGEGEPLADSPDKPAGNFAGDYGEDIFFENAEVLENERTYYDNVAYYTQYLENVAGDEDELSIYADTYGEGEDAYTEVVVENNSAYYFTGAVAVASTEHEESKLLKVLNLAPNDYESFYFEAEAYPNKYLIDEVAFYKFTYPAPKVDYYISYDGNDEGFWGNAYLAGGDLQLEHVKAIVEHLYAGDVLSGYLTDYAVYFYAEEFAETGEVPDRNTAGFGAYLSFADKEIELYQMTAGIETYLEVLVQQ